MNSRTSGSRPQLPLPSRRRPPTRIATPTLQRQSHSTEADSNIMRINIPGNTQTTPVFASVHRPRQSSISAIQRENQQQRYAPQMQQQYNHQLNSEFAITGQFMENNRYQHSMAVTIPHPQKNQLQQMQQSYHHNQAQQNQQNHQPKLILSQQQQQQHQQQHQQQPPHSNSRIPSSLSTAPVSVAPNFNQISKTATSLLNEIYEKHLLSQTTFENVNAAAAVNVYRGITAGAVQQSDADHNFNNLCHQVSSSPIHQQYHHPRPQQQQQQQQQSCNVELNVQRNGLNYASNVGEHFGSGNGGAGNSGDLMLQRNFKTRMPKRTNENLPTKVQQKNGKYLCDSKQSIASGKKYPSDGSEPSLYEISYVQRSKMDVNLFYGGSDLGAMQSKQFTSDINGKISVRTEPVGGNFYQENVYSGCNAIGNIGSVGMSVGAGNGVVSGAVNNKYENRNSKINIMLETAQAMAQAVRFARAAQRLANNNAAPKTRVPDMPTTERGGYCGALQRAPPAMPAGLARRLANKDNFGMGKVKVMLRIADGQPDGTNQHFMCIDKKKRQVTLTDPATAVSTTSTAASSQERGPMVAAPKMFAFDGLFTCEDTQADVCSSALSEVIPAVLEGSDGCLLTLGYPQAGQSKTMFGSVSSAGDLGAIPCAISWLFKGINERRQKSGARFSVRVSALGVNATKPGSSSKDLLAAHKTESDESPSSYLRDDFLGGPTELRAPTAERAALFLDAALSGRHQGVLDPALIFTLHVYQYSLGGKGAVAGGRSRLHLIDLGGCANRNGGIPLSGIGNVLLAILSGQRHPPNRDHPLTPLLKDCLAPLTCHVSVLAHVSHRQNHTDALTTIQLASRIHRLRRRKHRFPLSSDKLGVNHTGNQSGSSEGPDPSSSDLSADTVIYMGPSDDATDGEHPPVYLPSLSSGDNRCSMNKALKGSAVEKASKLPLKKTTTKPQSPVPAQRTDSLKRRTVSTSSPIPCDVPQQNISAYQYGGSQTAQNPGPMPNSPKMIAAAYRNVGINKGSNVPTPKGSPLRRPNTSNQGSPKRHVNSEEEQWVDGPRLSRSKVAEARHLLREINHVKQREQWIDGPKMSPAKSLVAGALPGSTSTPGYGYMDSHKKIMIRQWVENQTSQIFQPSGSNSPQHQSSNQANSSSQLFRNHQPEFDRISVGSSSHAMGDIVNPNGMNSMQPTVNTAENAIRVELKQTQDQSDEKSERSTSSAFNKHNDSQEEEDQDSGPSEVPPALPLIEPLGSREISHDSLHMMCSRHVSRESLGIASHQSHQTHHTLASHQSHLIHVRDCGLQVTEDDIVKAMGDHPLSILSQGNVSVVSSFNNIGDAFGDCSNGDRTKHQFDQLARLREIYTSQLAMAEVVPAFRINDACSVFSEPAYRFIAGPGSVCSEPAYRPPSPRCSGCRQSIGLSRTPSQNSLPSLNGIVTIAGMEQYASLRHPDGASDPNLQQKSEHNSSVQNIDETTELLQKPPSIDLSEHKLLHSDTQMLTTKHQLQQQQLQQPQQQLPPLPLSTPEAYDSGHDSSTPRTSKHSGISRRAESGYHSVATVRDSDESSYGSEAYRGQRITVKKRTRQDKSLCNWLRNPFTCTYPDTEGEISDF